jgi:hypothetical protein
MPNQGETLFYMNTRKAADYLGLSMALEIVVHHVQSMHHDRDCDVIDRERHADLHALVCRSAVR